MFNVASIYHRPDSEMAYLIDKNTIQIRLKTSREVEDVQLMFGDPYQFDGLLWKQNAQKMQRIADGQGCTYWQINIKMPYQRIKYAFLIQSQGQQIFYGDRGFYPVSENYYGLINFYFTLPYFHEKDMAKTPEWVKKTIWYQIFPERFANSDPTNDPENTLPWGSAEPTPFNFFGGDLQGVLDHLDYLQNLGINGLYFCPLFKATSNHKYDTIDYYQIDPQFGTNDDFKRLVQEAHRRGMKIMIDAVFNHTGDDVPMWQDVLKKGEQSLDKDWYHIKEFPAQYDATDNYEVGENITYDTFAFNPHMPKLNTANPEVKNYLLDIAMYWIREFDIDAWRLDVANELDHAFWREFKEACDSCKDEFYILGEVWHNAEPWLAGDQFTGTMNYAFCESIEQYFLTDDLTSSEVVEILNDQLMRYKRPVNQANLNMLDSHDKPRLLTKVQGNIDKLQALFVFMFSQMGTPCLYYGTEIGMQGASDPLNRACMIWDENEQNLELLSFFKELLSIRHQYWSLFTEGISILESKDDIIIQTHRNEEFTIQGIFGKNLDNIDISSKNILLQGKYFILYQL